MANRYWVGTGNWDLTNTANWSTSSGGAGGASVPGTSDDVIFDAASGSGTCTLTVNTNSVKSFNASAFTGTIDAGSGFVLNISNAVNGDVVMPVAGGGIGNLGLFYGTSTSGTLRSNGKSIRAVTVGNAANANVGVVTLLDGLSSFVSVTLNSGTLDIGSFNHAWATFASSSTQTRTLATNTSNITVNATGTAWNTAITTGLTVTGTAPITFTGTSGVIMDNGGTSGNARAYSNITFSGIGTHTLRAGSTMNMADLTIQSPCVGLNFSVVTYNLQNLSVTGLVATRTILNSGVTGSATNINVANAPSLTYVDFRDINAGGAGGTWTGPALGNGYGNTGITFPAPVNKYWVGNTGSFGTAANWSLTSGGAGGAGMPLLQDTAIFDANSFSAINQTVTFNAPQYGTIDATAVTKSGILYQQTVGNANCYGSMNFGMAYGQGAFGSSGAGLTLFLRGRGAHTISKMWSYSGQPPLSITVDCFGGTYTLAGDVGGLVSNVNTYSTTNVISGSLDINGFNWNTLIFGYGGTGVKGFYATGGGSVGCCATTASTVFSINVNNTTQSTDLLDIHIKNAATNIASVFGGSRTYGKLICNAAGRSANIAITDQNNSFLDFEMSDASNSRNLSLPTTGVTTLRAPRALRNFIGASGRRMSLVSASSGIPATLALPNGYAGGGGSDWHQARDIVATTNPWYAGANSVDLGGNTNVIFTAEPTSQMLLVM